MDFPHDLPVVGFMPIARTTFDIPLAQALADQARDQVARCGMMVFGPDELITDLEAAAEIAEEMTAEPIDALVIFQATFADSTLVMRLVEKVNAPVLLWAVPEERTGGRLRLNSLCGINLAGHALTRAGKSYDYVYALPGDPAVADKVRPLARAGWMRRQLAGTRLGRVGEHPDGFDSCQFDPDRLLERLGVGVEQITLEDVFSRVRALKPAEVAPLRAVLSGRVDGLDEVDQPALEGTLGTYTVLSQLAEERGLTGMAVRCWPQFFTDLGCAACGALSLMNDDLIPCSCETDVNGALTQLILQGFSGEPAFGTDMVGFYPEEDVAVLWHCGKAPLSMADPATQPRAAIHSNRRLPLLMEFPLKPGQVTLARLSQAQGDFRLVIGRGEIIQAPPSFSGTSGVIRFEHPASAVLDTILSQGLEHHLALTYGDYVRDLECLAGLLNLPVLML